MYVRNWLTFVIICRIKSIRQCIKSNTITKSKIYCFILIEIDHLLRKGIYILLAFFECQGTVFLIVPPPESVNV